MRRLASALLAVIAALAIASCSKDVPSERYECTCVDTSRATDNSRDYTFCESDATTVKDDATTQCEKDFDVQTGCECTCTHSGSCTPQATP